MGFLRDYAELDLDDLITGAQVLGPTSELPIKEIVRRFEPLTRAIGNRLAHGKEPREDLESAVRYGLIQAARRHSGTSQTFPAYAKRYMTGAGQRERSRWLPPVGISVTTLEELSENMTEMVATVEHPSAGDGWGDGDTADAIAALDPVQQHLLRRRYIDDADLAEIAAESGTSVSAVSQRLRTVHRRLQCVLAA